jgi:release factor glutamine methyltransferase
VTEPALELTRKAAAVLAERGFANARLEAELLLAGVLGIRRLDLYLQHERPVDGAELERYRAWVRRRLKHEPLQYIVGTAAFRKLELHVDPRVLIPRPETEVLVGEVLSWAMSRAPLGAALDIGTGSGAIALSLAREGSFARIVATDVSQDALDVARDNAQRAGLSVGAVTGGAVTGGVEFRCGAYFEPLREGERFTAIVANPPYVADDERAALAPEIREHEPASALLAGPDGLRDIEALIAGAPPWLEAGGLLALEIGDGQAEAVLARVSATGAYVNARVVADLTGRMRVLIAEAAVQGSKQRRVE